MDTITCIDVECSREPDCRGYCWKHYNSGRLSGEIPLLTDEDRFIENVDFTDTCWLWTGNLNDSDYGRFGSGKKSHRAHRWAWEQWVGPIPEGFDIDHICRVHRCVNPDHLEPTTQYINKMRGESPFALNKRKEFCPSNHEYTIENTYTSKSNMRHCRKCGAERARAYRARKKAELA